MADKNFTDYVTVIDAAWLNDVNDHTYNDVTDVHTAAAITNTPAGNIVATDVQAAITELDTEKAKLAGDAAQDFAAAALAGTTGTFTGAVSGTTITGTSTVRGNTSTGSTTSAGTVGVASSSGNGVFGQSDSGVAVYGLSATQLGVRGESSGAGTGVLGISATGYGVQAEADTTTPASAALHLVPQDTNPSSPSQGNVYVNSGDGSLRWYNGTAWKDVTSANAINTTGASVNVSASAPPSGAGEVLLSTSATTAAWTVLGGGGDALTTNPLSQFAATTSLQLKNTISDETGSGALVFADTPTLVTPLLGTPTSGVLTNCTASFAGAVSGTTGAFSGAVSGSGGTFTSGGAGSALSATSSGGSTTIRVIDTGSAGANIRFEGNGGTTPNKYIRCYSGNLEFVNSAYDTVIATLTDAGAFSCPTGAFSGAVTTGALAATTSGSIGTHVITDTGANGVNLKFVGDGGTTPNKYIRAKSGNLEFINSAYSAVLASLTDAGNFTATGSIAASSTIKSSGGGIGYATGAGGTVTQITDRLTGVTLNALTGNITLTNISTSIGDQNAFVLTNSFIEATDYLAVQVVSGEAGYVIGAACASGSATITLNTIRATNDQPTLKFMLFKSVTS